MSSKKNKKQAEAVAPSGTVNKPMVAIVDNSSLVELKEETLRWIFSILGAVLVYWVVAQLIQSTYHPDVNELIQLANKFGFSGDARPEPMESMLFRSGVVVITLSLLLFYFLLSKMKWIKTAATSQFFLPFSTIAIALIIAVIYLDFAAANPFGPGTGEQPQSGRDVVAKTNFEFFFDDLFLGGHLLLYTFIIVPCVSCIFYFGIRKYKWDTNNSFNKVLSGTLYAMAGGILFAVVAMNSFDFPYTFENKYDFNAVYYSMTQVYAGVPMLVDGFSNTYGLYPHFLNLLFHFIGLSILKFSCVMAILAGIGFLFNFLTLRSVVRNKVILLLGFCTVVFFPYLDFKLLTGFDSWFAFFPIRYIVPSTLVFLTTIYLRGRSQAIYRFIFTLMGFFILWNPEIGMVSYIAWVLFNVYNDFFTEQGRVNVRKIFFHIGAAIIVVTVVMLLFKGLFYAVYGANPELNLLFGFITVFGKVGFGLLPMSLVHPWNLEALVLILGFTYVIIKWLKKERTDKTSIIFLISIIGLGFMVYFQGRSHNWSFCASSGFSLILLTILGDELWEQIKGNNLFSLHLLFVIFLFTISFSFFEVIINAGKIKDLVFPDDDKDKQATEQAQVMNNADFINKHSKEKEKIFILTARQYEGLYFNGDKRQSAFNPGYQDMFLNTDLYRMAKRISDSSYNVFLEPAVCNYYFMNRPLAAVAASYEVKDTSKTMSMLGKRKTKTISQSFFSHSNNVFHRKYSDDTMGIGQRINDAIGINPVSLNSEFSVEVLFHSNPQLYQYATLIGNMNDSSGFVIARIINTTNYFFGINGKGMALSIPDNQWVYLVMNVFPDHFEVYSNGVLAGTFPLAFPAKVSREKLGIGNGGFLRYYIGAISEVALNDKVIDGNQIQSEWNEITPVVSK